MLDFKPMATFRGNPYPDTESYAVQFTTEKGFSVHIRETEGSFKTIELHNAEKDSFFLRKVPCLPSEVSISSTINKYVLNGLGVMSIYTHYDSTGTKSSLNEWYLCIDQPVQTSQVWKIRLIGHKGMNPIIFNHQVRLFLETLRQKSTFPLQNVQYLFESAEKGLLPTTSLLSVEKFRATQSKNAILVDIKFYSKDNNDFFDKAMHTF